MKSKSAPTPSRVFSGHVDSLAPASGQEFALPPPDNSTGNFTKIVQRIPIKILLDGDVADAPRPGMSVTPTIDTRAAAFAVATRDYHDFGGFLSGLTLLGFPSFVLCDSWPVGLWRADHGRNVEVGS